MTARHRVYVSLLSFSFKCYKVRQDACANLTQRSQSLMLVQVAAEVKLLRMGLVLGWVPLRSPCDGDSQFVFFF